MPSFARLTILALLWGGLSVSLAAADAPDPSAILARYREQAEAARLGLMRLHAQRLRQEQRRMGKLRRYQEAAKFRDERARIEAVLGGKSRGPAELWLFPWEATKLTGMEMAKDRDASLRLTSAKNQVEWPLPEIPAGGYEVEIAYASAEGATVRVQEARFLATAKLLATQDKALQTASLGLLKITDAHKPLTLSVENVGAGGFTLHHVRLISQAP